MTEVGKAAITKIQERCGRGFNRYGITGCEGKIERSDLIFRDLFNKGRIGVRCRSVVVQHSVNINTSLEELVMNV